MKEAKRKKQDVSPIGVLPLSGPMMFIASSLVLAWILFTREIKERIVDDKGEYGKEYWDRKNAVFKEEKFGFDGDGNGGKPTAAMQEKPITYVDYKRSRSSPVKVKVNDKRRSLKFKSSRNRRPAVVSWEPERPDVDFW